MHCSRLPAVALATVLGTLLAPAAQAVDLIAIGSLPGNGSDFSGQSGALENGVPGNLLGGLGSGLAWAGGSSFLALPDRGPNATDWPDKAAGATVDATASYIPRFHTLTLALTARPDAATRLPYTLTPTLVSTTLLYSRSPLTYGGTVGGHPAVPALNSASHHYFSGRSDNFDPATGSSVTTDARLDPEGIRLSRSGRTVFISDEYGPFVYQFDRATGQRGRTVTLPASLFVAKKSATGAAEIAGNTSGRVANKGMEGLAISPDGSTLFGFIQSPLLQDGGDGGRANRIVKIDVASGKTVQFAYDNFLADRGKAFNSSEVLAVNDHVLLVLERDGKGRGDGSKAVVKRIYKIDLRGAADVSALVGEAALLAKAVPKTLFVDIAQQLLDAGFKASEIPAKLESMAFGADIVIGGKTRHTLYVGNDNDFLATTPDGLPNPNQWFVFAVSDADLGGATFVNQSFAP